MEISVILATFRRNDILKKTLDSFCSLNQSGLDWELLIADNAADASTLELVGTYNARLPIRYVAEPKPGKNNALLAALRHTSGSLLIFTDDDIIAPSNWLQEYRNATARHPESDIFGGQILPHFPNGARLDPRIPFDHQFTKSAYALTFWEPIEGPVSPSRIWGPNMAVRRGVFEKGISFNPEIGPNGKNYVMGSETEFVTRANEAGCKITYLPSVIVQHQLREEQLTLSWLEGRAYRTGRARAKVYREFDEFNKVFGVPRFVWRKVAQAYVAMHLYNLLNNFGKGFDAMIEFGQLQGAIFEMRQEYHEAKSTNNNISSKHNA